MEILYRNSEGHLVIRENDGQINVYRTQQVVVKQAYRMCSMAGDLVITRANLRAALAELSMLDREKILKCAEGES
jgi:hypothetical protein